MWGEPGVAAASFKPADRPSGFRNSRVDYSVEQRGFLLERRELMWPNLLTGPHDGRPLEENEWLKGQRRHGSRTRYHRQTSFGSGQSCCQMPARIWPSRQAHRQKMQAGLISTRVLETASNRSSILNRIRLVESNWSAGRSSTIFDTQEEWPACQRLSRSNYFQAPLCQLLGRFISISCPMKRSTFLL